MVNNLYSTVPINECQISFYAQNYMKLNDTCRQKLIVNLPHMDDDHYFCPIHCFGNTPISANPNLHLIYIP